jgi:predicted membrane-bound spermidine synthase
MSCAALFLILCGAGAKRTWDNEPIFPIVWTKGVREPASLYQRWNSFSRIRVWGDPDTPSAPPGNYSEIELPKDFKVKQLNIDIDGGAQTSMFHYRGDAQEVKHLFYDMTNIAHYLRPKSDTLIIGVGGGRDLLSALVFGDKSVTGVEINGNIIRASTKDFADFTGHYDKDPRVKIVNDEARSYITRSNEKFDIIQASLIDTWAASASGAFALAENSLYTLEAWHTFLEHLTDRGVITMHRWFHPDTPAEFYRLTALAAQALTDEGETPRENLLVARSPATPHADIYGRVGTLLVSKHPFSKDDVDNFTGLCKKMGFEVALTPKSSTDPILERIASGKDLDQLAKELPYNVIPPTDDNPFFFQTISLSHIADKVNYVSGRNTPNIMAAALLLLTLISVLIFSVYCFRVPYLQTRDKASLAGSKSLFCYFFLIGCGFMFLEISQVQRLSIFLGHPTYGLSVVLFTLLLSTGTGSLATKRIWQDSNYLRPAAVILSVLAIFGLLSPVALAFCSGGSTHVRIVCAFALLFPMGFVLGMPFPMGMTIAAKRFPTITPWLWGINGAASVCGSVLTVVISIWAGITASYWLGFATYIAAMTAYHYSLTAPHAEST